MPPLWLIGVCLFLPTVRACERMESPASLAWRWPPYFAGLLAPYLVAQVVAIVVLVALARGRVATWATRTVAALVVVAGASAVLLAFCGINGHSAAEQAWSVVDGAAFVGGIAMLVRARRREPWLRLQRMVAAYTVMTLPLAALLVRIVVEDGVHQVGVGAPLFLAAVVVLAVVQARALSSRA